MSDGLVIDLLSSDDESDVTNVEQRAIEVVPQQQLAASASVTNRLPREDSGKGGTNEASSGKADRANGPRASGKESRQGRQAPSSTVGKQQQQKQQGKKRAAKKSSLQLKRQGTSKKELQAGLVLEEDTDHHHNHNHNHNHNGQAAASSSSSSSGGRSDEGDDTTTMTTVSTYISQQRERERSNLPPILYHDPQFEPIPSSIEGANAKKAPKCRCSPSQPATLSYNKNDRPYYHCAKRKCKYHKWAYAAQQMRWYRFGTHTNHVLVTDAGFSASDLVQGKVGDCWFLSALAVIAERPDLIMRLFGNGDENRLRMNKYGIVQLTLFLDGYWTNVVLDNFLPCIVDDEEESTLQTAIRRSLLFDGQTAGMGGGSVPSSEEAAASSSSSRFDPHALSDKNMQVLSETNEFLEQDRAKKDPFHRNRSTSSAPRKLNRPVTDLAYSKARQNQLWVPLLEKAYAKAHGCYHAISGGHIAEAFLDLTGAPTLVYNFDSPSFHARTFWSKLMSYRKQRLPMGCGTAGGGIGLGQVGLVGMHAYSILDVREVRNVGLDFFKDKMLAGTLGNVSGFTDFDGTVRLLRIRNPHGRGEWKGEFSDNSAVWEKLLQNKGQSAQVCSLLPPSSSASAAAAAAPPSPALERTMTNDGTFWMDYDNFLMGFSNVDIVLAFQGNHAKSFASNFPAKKSNHRCTRAFEVSLLDVQPGVPSRDTVELFIMGLQKTRRGAYHGRTDRKKSYKVCDLGFLVGKGSSSGPADATGEGMEFDSVEGQMLGFKRNGHHRLILNRAKNRSLVVIPISFGHPAATDKEMSFALRFVSDAPLLIRELPHVPRMDAAIQRFCLESSYVSNFSVDNLSQGRQGKKRILLEDSLGLQLYGEPTHRVFFIDCLANGGGTAFVYLGVNDSLLKRRGTDEDFRVSFSVEANCRGMVCRTEDGLLEHETVSKGKKFEAAWRRFTKDFRGETKSRLLMVLAQSGMDTQMGAIKCARLAEGKSSAGKNGECKSLDEYFHSAGTSSSTLPSSAPAETKHDDYDRCGIFTRVENKVKDKSCYAYSEGQPSFIGIDVADVSGTGSSQDAVDLELETALALSRGDVELQRVLERSRNDVGRFDPSNRRQDTASNAGFKVSPAEQLDHDMEKALLASMKESRGASVCAGVTGDGGKTFSQEMEEAIKLSLSETKKPSSLISAAQGGDSTSQGNHNVISLISDDSPGGEEPCHCMPESKKRRADPDVIEITDDRKSVTSPKGDTESNQGAVDPSEKRRLAAEAAMKRFQSKTK